MISPCTNCGEPHEKELCPECALRHPNISGDELVSPNKCAIETERNAGPKLRSTDGMEELEAAHLYTNSEAIESADVIDSAGYPLWYGHAVRTAFQKGIEWERSRSSIGKISGGCESALPQIQKGQVPRA